MKAPRSGVAGRTGGIAGIAGLLVGALACGGKGAPPPAALCAEVAESLVSLEVGNYAPAEARAALVPAKLALCAKHRVTVAEAACLAKASDPWSAARCVPRMFPQVEATGCEPVVAKLRAAIVTATANDPGTAPMVEKAVAAMRASCAEDGWPEPLLGCIMAAPSTELTALSDCEGKIPPGLKQKLEERLRTMVP